MPSPPPDGLTIADVEQLLADTGKLLTAHAGTCPVLEDYLARVAGLCSLILSRVGEDER